MHFIHGVIEGSQVVAWIVMIGGFVILARCADVFVESAVSLAEKFRIPKLVIGIVLVSFATTAPELSVSALSAFRGRPQIALGNAVGSVLCNTGLGLSLCALFSAAAVPVIPHVLKTAGAFFAVVAAAAFACTLFDYTLNAWEGGVLVAAFFIYIAMLFRQHRRGVFNAEDEFEEGEVHPEFPLRRLAGLFALGLGGILLSSDLIVTSAVTIAHGLGVPDSIVALTLVAFGTSVPEVATCITAARKRHGALAIGNIMGANIMNICWVAGASAIVNPLVLTRREIYFMFPVMFVMTMASLFMLRAGWRLTRRQGFVLLTLYVLYLAASVWVFKPA